MANLRMGDRSHPLRAVRCQRNRRPLSICVLLLLACSFLHQRTMGAPLKEVRRVLLLYSMGPSSPTISLIDHQIRTLLEESPYQIEFYTEYMDTNLFPEKASQQEVRKWYIHKYRDRQPDVIVAIASAPIQFMVDSHAKFFPNTPIVFCCASEDQPDTPKIDSQFSGVWTKLDPLKTLEAALLLQPDIKHVVVVSGAAASDRDLADLVRQSLRSYEGRLAFTYLTGLPMPVLLEQLKRLPEGTIVIYTNIQQDGAGTHFMSATQALPMITASANAPVFVLADLLVGQGAVGGYVTSFAEQGIVVSRITTKILKGEKPQDIPIVRGANAYMFDWPALQRWGLNESALPPDSILLNRQPSLWETHKRYIIAGISLCFAETLLILGLLWQRTKRKKVEKSLVDRLTFESLLSDLSTTFINLPEPQVYSNIENSLGRIGEFLEVERITLFEFSHDGSHLIPTSAWGKEKISSLLPLLETKQWPWWTPRALRGEEVLCSDPNHLPDEASNERQYLLDSGIRSVASVPLQMGGGSIGCLSFVSKNRRVEWTRDLVRQLTVFAEIFSNALKRKRTEAILRESEERFRLVANTAPVMIWMSGSDKLCTYFNQPWLDFTGRPLELELGNGWAHSVHIEDLQKCLATYDKAFDRRHPFKMEYRLRRHDGEYRWIVDIGVPRFNADDSFAGYIGSCQDVTERKLAAEALAGVSRKLIDAQEKARARIARELHDDINQRLALLAIELQQLAQSPPPTVDEVGAYIYRLSTQVFEIGNDVQAISHSLHSSKLEYLGIVAAAKSLCKEFSEQQGVVVDFRHEGIPRIVSSDISLCMFRVLQEALHNAVKHSGAQHFEVEMHGEANEITLTVSDSGVGFDTETGGDSPGLGLISMRERVSLVDGTISITSKPAHGTVISVRVPAGKDGASPQHLGSKTVGEFEIPADLAGR